MPTAEYTENIIEIDFLWLLYTTLYCRLWQDSRYWWTYFNDICSFTSIPYSFWTAEGIFDLQCHLLL